MVRHLFYLTLFCFSSTAWAVTADELRTMTGDAERQKRIKAGRVQGGDLKSVIDKMASDDKPAPSSGSTDTVKPSVAPEPKPDKQPISTKHSKPAQGQGAAIKGKQSGSKPAKKPAVPAGYYIAPARDASTKKGIKSDAVKARQNYYGIRLGTWMQAELTRDTNSSEPGLVELHLKSDVKGDRRTLAQGTQFFAKGTLNKGSKRWDGHIVKAITPDGRELELKGIVFDKKRLAGLAGSIPQKSLDESVNTGVQKGALAAASDIVTQAGGGPAGAFMNEAGQTVISAEGNKIVDRNADDVIFVSPQTLYIRVEETF